VKDNSFDLRYIIPVELAVNCESIVQSDTLYTAQNSTWIGLIRCIEVIETSISHSVVHEASGYAATSIYRIRVSTVLLDVWLRSKILIAYFCN